MTAQIAQIAWPAGGDILQTARHGPAGNVFKQAPNIAEFSLAGVQFDLTNASNVPAWVSALASPSGDLPTVAADFANDRYYIAGTGAVGIGDVFLYTADDTPFAPGLEPDGYQQLGDGLQAGFGDIYLSPAAQTAAGQVATAILGIDIDVTAGTFFADFSIQDGSFDEIVEWDFTNDSMASFPNSVRDISGDQADVPLMDLTTLLTGPAKIGATYSVAEVAGSINGEAAALLAMLPAAYGDRAHFVVQTAYGEWFASLVIYPPQTDAHLATMTAV